MSSNNNKMSVTQLTLLTALNMMGSGIIMLPTKLAEVGTFSILSWLVTATGSTALAYAFAKCGMLSRKQGGMGGYAEYTFGKSGNFLANYTYAVSLVIANVAIAITVVGYLTAFFDVELSPIGTCLATIVTLWVCTSLNFKGPKITGYISNFSAWGAPGRGSLDFRLVLVQPDPLRRKLEPEQHPVLRRAERLHFDDALGLPRS